MRFLRFYVDQDLKLDTSVRIDGKQAHYALNVLRLKTGAEVQLFNGRGGEYKGCITDADKRGLTVLLEAFDPANRAPRANITLGIGILKRDAMDLAIQKAVEIGVTVIQPLITERISVPNKQIKSRHEHWQAIAVSSCEQCGQNIIPTVNAPLRLDDWCVSATGIRLFGHPNATLQSDDRHYDGNDFSLLVGPEGGFSSAEYEYLAAQNFQGMCLGDRILRAETAVASLLTLLNHGLERNRSNL